MWPRLLSLAVLPFFLSGNPHAHDLVAPSFDPAEAIATSQATIGAELGDRTFIDTRGRPVRLSSFRGKPLILSLVYTSCYHTCSTLTQRLHEMVEVARDALGDDAFSVATVGFDVPNDTPERMRAFAEEQGIDDPRWSFLSADAATIEGLLRDVGFTYYPSPRGFDHLMQVSVVDAAGAVYRHVYGETFDAPALVEPLKELYLGARAARREPESWLESVRVLCTVYDPRTGRYALDYSLIVLVVSGLVCLGGIAIFILRAWREHDRGVVRG